MKPTPFSLFVILASIGAFVVSGCANLEHKARLTKGQAETIALHRAKGGTVKSSELEKEFGKLIWSVDIAKQGTRKVTEVAVDAQSGEVVAFAIETPADEAAEARKEAMEKSR